MSRIPPPAGSLWSPQDDNSAVGAVAKLREALGKPDPRKLARTTDPATSHAAAREILPDLAGLRRAAVEAVANHPGLTATELSRAVGISDPRVLNRRLGECEKLGVVVRGPVRVCSVTGRSAATWRTP